jgi:hypothetical protein
MLKHFFSLSLFQYEEEEIRVKGTVARVVLPLFSPEPTHLEHDLDTLLSGIEFFLWFENLRQIGECSKVEPHPNKKKHFAVGFGLLLNSGFGGAVEQWVI